MAEYRSIRVERGSGGFGGPLVITPTEKRNKVMFITGGGAEPECLAKILELSGLTPVNGFKTNCPEDELALVIIDCGGTLRCGIYPKKRIPTINTNPVGKSGPLAQFITEDIYVSGVTSKQISLADETEAAPAEPAAPAEEKTEEKQDGVKFTADMKISETLAKQEKKSFITPSDWASARSSTRSIRRRAMRYRPASPPCSRSWRLSPCSSASSAARASATRLPPS